MWPFKEKEIIDGFADKPIFKPDLSITCERAGYGFETHLLEDMEAANRVHRGITPWNLLAQYVISLERRVKELEAK